MRLSISCVHWSIGVVVSGATFGLMIGRNGRFPEGDGRRALKCLVKERNGLGIILFATSPTMGRSNRLKPGLHTKVMAVLFKPLRGFPICTIMQSLGLGMRLLSS